MSAGGGNPAEGELIEVIDVPIDQAEAYALTESINRPATFSLSLLWFDKYKKAGIDAALLTKANATAHWWYGCETKTVSAWMSSGQLCSWKKNLPSTEPYVLSSISMQGLNSRLFTRKSCKFLRFICSLCQWFYWTVNLLNCQLTLLYESTFDGTAEELSLHQSIIEGAFLFLPKTDFHLFAVTWTAFVFSWNE